MSTLAVGDHRFTLTDARKTLLHALDLLDLYPSEAIERQGPRRARIRSAIAGVPLDTDDVAVLDPVLRTVWRELLDAREELIASGSVPRSTTGDVAQVSSSKGGVPKLAVDRAEVGFDGLAGDRQHTRVHHGRPWQALCLWSTEVIDELAAEGHPIGPGCAGENVTITGLHWPEVRPGVRLQVGTARCQVMAYAVPCKKNGRWFHDHDFSRIHHSRGPVSRVYAVVFRPGVVAPGDPVVLEPD